MNERERDRRIAELKGWKFTDRGIWEKEGCQYYHAELPYYSTNDKDALELWYELPSPKAYYELENELINSPKLYVCKLGEIEYYGTSFADVVSKAWEAWKKGEGE